MVQNQVIFRTEPTAAANHGSRCVSFLIEEGIRPLVEALNQLPFVETVYSCEGHFERAPDERFLPTAYVTFGVNDARRFPPLYEALQRTSGTVEGGFIRLTYDCILGRYTLSAWADAGIGDPQDKRRTVDSLVAQLTRVVCEHPAEPAGAISDIAERGRYPCGGDVPPCALTIPAEPVACPFIDPPARKSRAYGK